MSARASGHPIPRPFLKWVGGKGQLLGELAQAVDQAGAFKRYHEPFVGGGALFFALYRAQGLGRSQAYLSDNNARLVETYQGVRDATDEIVFLLREHTERHGRDYYYEVRATTPDTAAARAARIIYLNKTCFNGLFRENSKGQFNVPMGKYKNPMICDEPNLRAVAEALSRAKIECRPFASVARKAKAGDLVYFDPPYHPVSATASFTSYHEKGFGEEDQRALADTCRTLDARGVRFMLSNSDTPLIRELYESFNLHVVMATRMVNTRADRRGKVREVLVRNF